MSTGHKTDALYLYLAVLMRQYRDNVFSMKRYAADVIPQYNQAIRQGRARIEPVKMFFHNVTTISEKRNEQCTVNPVFETFYKGGVHAIEFNYNERDLDVLDSSSYQQHFSFASDYTI